MIIYFTGTGNSRYASEVLNSVLDDEVICVNDILKNGQFPSSLDSDTPFVFVTPTYAWRIPRLIEELILNVTLTKNQKVYFVMTCGGEIYNAEKYNKRLALKKELDYCGTAEILMPENYITMFSAPPKNKIEPIIKDAEQKLLEVAQSIKNKQPLAPTASTPLGKFMSGAVNTMFYPICVSAKGFYTTEKCIVCGKCVNICPLENIRLENNVPKWSNNCTQCMACICSCPVQAIEYKNKTKGKDRYFNTKKYSNN
ncbi:MAG: EFR1 family ferrodoxin [Clostridiales bacterium]|nr:EFR1 family ferrodoxin [Clostridiales bacterium]